MYLSFSILIKPIPLQDAEENVESSGRVLKPCGPLWEEGGSGAKLFGNQALSECRTENSQARTSPSEENKANKNQLQKVRKTDCKGTHWWIAEIQWQWWELGTNFYDLGLIY